MRRSGSAKKLAMQTTSLQIPDTGRNRQRHVRESGFALLMIYAMAAIIAITLYMELPRVAFEAQRDKEQLLIDRGEQYSRAVMLYVRKFNRYPADFDALQNTQNLRFLRRKYVDPMTGKDDWRIIHVGPGGVFTDSLLYTKKKDANKPEADPNTSITQLQQVGGTPAGAGQSGVNIAARQRPSDQPGAPGDPNNTQRLQQGQNGQPAPNNPGAVNNNNPGAINGPVQVTPDGRVVPVFQNQPNPNQFNPAQNQFNPNLNNQNQNNNSIGTLQMGAGLQMGVTTAAPGTPNQAFPNQAQPSFPSTGFPNQGFPNQGLQNQGFPNQGAPNPTFPNQGFPPGQPVANPVGQLPAGSPFPNTQFPNGQFPNAQFQAPNTQQGNVQNGFPGQAPNTPPGSAANLINQILTSPRPGGLNGLGAQQGQVATTSPFGNSLPANGSPGAANNTGTPLPQQSPGQTIGGGMAGVASKVEQDGVKVYRDRTSYNEWEFVYDITKDSSRGGAAGQTATPTQGANPAANTSPVPNGSLFGGSPFGGPTSPTGPANPPTNGPGR